MPPRRFEPEVPDHGKDVEKMLGQRSEAYQERKEELRGIPLGQLFDIVKRPEFQPFEDPADPKELPFPRDLHLEVANKLEVYRSQLCYYTTIDSPLDMRAIKAGETRKGGVDAFFELDVGEGKYLRVTLDITQYTGEQYEEEIADVKFLWPSGGIDRTDREQHVDGSKSGEDLWFEKVDEVAESVAEQFRNKAQQFGFEIKALKPAELEKSRRLKEEYKQGMPRLSTNPLRARLQRSREDRGKRPPPPPQQPKKRRRKP